MTPNTKSPTGGRQVRAGTDHLVLTRTFTAPIEDVWSALTEPERMQRWIGTWAGDPTSGEVTFRMTAEGEDAPEEVHVIDECVPPRRLVAHSKSPQPWSETGDGDRMVWTYEIDLAELDGTTTLTFAQMMDRGEVAENVGPGWEYYLDRLRAAVSGGDMAAIDFDDYYPAQSEHYRAEFAGSSGSSGSSAGGMRAT